MIGHLASIGLEKWAHNDRASQVERCVESPPLEFNGKLAATARLSCSVVVAAWSSFGSHRARAKVMASIMGRARRGAQSRTSIHQRRRWRSSRQVHVASSAPPGPRASRRRPHWPCVAEPDHGRLPVGAWSRIARAGRSPRSTSNWTTKRCGSFAGSVADCRRLLRTALAGPASVRGEPTPPPPTSNPNHIVRRPTATDRRSHALGRGNQSGVVARGPRDIHHWSRAGCKPVVWTRRPGSLNSRRRTRRCGPGWRN
jgi:hypothetical protein